MAGRLTEDDDWSALSLLLGEEAKLRLLALVLSGLTPEQRRRLAAKHPERYARPAEEASK